MLQVVYKVVVGLQAAVPAAEIQPIMLHTW